MNYRRKNLEILPGDNHFRRLRKAAQLSQEELAKAIDVVVSTIRRWEKGSQEPTMTLEQTRKYCNAVKIPFDALPDRLTDL